LFIRYFRYVKFITITITIASEAKHICTGTAILISFLTPASDVKVEAPVKFIERNDEILASRTTPTRLARRLSLKE
jgi:hypothetical protein